MSTSCLGGILGWFWSFVKNFFEGHTSPPSRSAFAPPVPLCNEPGYFDRFTNLLCVSLLQYRNTWFCVATSVKISVFGVHFWQGSFVYILRKWIFIFAPFPILFLAYFVSFFCSWFVLFCPIMFRAYCQPGRGGVTFDSLVNVPRYHVATLIVVASWSAASWSAASWSAASWSVEDVSHCFAVEDLKTYHVVKLLCGLRFCSCWGVHRRHRQLVVNTFKLTC